MTSFDLFRHHQARIHEVVGLEQGIYLVGRVTQPVGFQMEYLDIQIRVILYKFPYRETIKPGDSDGGWNSSDRD